MIDFRFVEKFIGFLEKLEYDLISWGFYDSSFSISEIQNILEKENYEEINSDWVRSKEEGYELEDLFSDLESNKLIYKISSFKNSNHEDHYRTRFGEGLRLIYRLKQRFKDNDWDSAPNLVSDIKCHLTTRKYPKFDQDFESCWLDLSPLCKNKNIQEKVFRALSSKTTARSSEPIKFAGFQRRAFNQI